MERVPMTRRGADALKAEVDQLKSVERPAVIAAIAEARAHGDLKENAEYHAAREKQSFIEGRIADIDGKLSHAQIIDVSKLDNQGVVVFGATVTLMNLETEGEVTYQIVGEDEANIEAGRISFASPIARSLIRKEEGSVVEVHAPNGVVEYEILKVEYLI
jgi:transcription elongation factor GreA